MLLSNIDSHSFSVLQQKGIFKNIINNCIYYDLLYKNELNKCHIFEIENKIIGYCYIDTVQGKIMAFEIFKPFQRKRFGLLLYFNILKNNYKKFNRLQLTPTCDSILFWEYISNETKNVLIS